MRRRLIVTLPIALLGLLVFAGAAAAGDGILGLPGTEPLARPLAPVTQAVAPVTDAVEPVTDAAVPVTQAAGPVTQAAAPVVTAAEPVAKAVDPVVQAAAPVVEQAARAAAPVVQAAAPVVRTVAETVAPVVQTAVATAAPVVRSVSETIAPVVSQVAETVAPVVQDVATPVAAAATPVTVTVGKTLSRTASRAARTVSNATAPASARAGDLTHPSAAVTEAVAATGEVSRDNPTQASGASVQAGSRRLPVGADAARRRSRAHDPGAAARPDRAGCPLVPAGRAFGRALDPGGRSGRVRPQRHAGLAAHSRAASARARLARRAPGGRRCARLHFVRHGWRTRTFLDDSGHDAEVPARCARAPLAPVCARRPREAGTRRLPARAPRLARYALPADPGVRPDLKSSKGDDMKRFLIASITCLALIVGVSPAAADGGLGGVLDQVTQTNQQNTNRSGDATASNENGTWQGNDQSQTGYGGDATTGAATTGGSGCCGSDGDATSGDAYGGDVTQSQEAANTNSTTQEAKATSKATQILPVNVNVPVCIAKSCETGDVKQSNTQQLGRRDGVELPNHTVQSNEQSQKGVGGDATSGDATAGSGDATTGKAVGGDVDQSQQASNSNETTQSATATSTATGPAGERERAGLHREALRDRRRRAVEHEPARAMRRRRTRAGRGRGTTSTSRASAATRPPVLQPPVEGLLRLGWRCDERRRLRWRRHAVAGGVERQQHLTGGVGGVEGDPVRAGERERAGLRRPALRDG